MSTEIELSEKPRGTVIKLEPAFALADGKALEPTKSEPVRIGRGISITQGFEVIVSSCLRHFQLNEPTVVKARNVEALHQARVAIRRLRSALVLFRPVVADQEFERIQSELRWLVAEFGDARKSRCLPRTRSLSGSASVCRGAAQGRLRSGHRCHEFRSISAANARHPQLGSWRSLAQESTRWKITQSLHEPAYRSTMEQNLRR